jgi:uncharacterized SAM-binding protein YcdF (DUF218 family)
MPLAPGTWLALLCGLGALLLLLGRARSGRTCVLLAATGFAAIALLPIDQWLLAPLENRFPPLPRDARVERVIVLGGAIDAALSVDRDSPALNSAAARITEMLTLAHRFPQARIVFTGGPMPNRPDGPPEADQVRRLATAIGLQEERILYENRSLTTWQNAVLTAELVHPTPDEAWVLVTSAAHMARSVGAFRAAGFRVIADPVGWKSFTDPSHRGSRSFAERLGLLEATTHEWLGLIYYRLRGRSSAWFPAPD